MLEQIAPLELKAKMYRGFADPTRLSILESLRDGERMVGAIVEATGQSQSNVSNHLSCLKECGLVTSRRDGKKIFYSIASHQVQSLLNDGDLVLREIRDCIRSCAKYDY
ncbi:MAG: metalloregulator ArsR/SmtB family transcription factor [Candidatus Methanomethylophilaceae archaeon]|nr:metalloregulator ArsR/SmtB family transcription factor [Candidatus Methanomethylophilaceae archaeon]